MQINYDFRKETRVHWIDHYAPINQMFRISSQRLYHDIIILLEFTFNFFGGVWGRSFER